MKVSQKIILPILLLLTLVAGYFSIEFIHGFSSAEQSSAVKGVKPKSVSTTLDVALIGSDARSKDESGRSDSLLVAQYNQKTQQAELVFIMRDSYVNIPGYGMDKIDAAYSYGGADLLNQASKENFKFEVPYCASITFQDFIDCVNELFPGGAKIDTEKSLDLDGVYINKEEQVIKAISQQLKDVTSIFKLPEAVGKLPGSVQADLPESMLLDCGMDFLKDNNKKIDTLSVPVDGSWGFNDNTPSGSVLKLDLTKDQEAIRKFLNN